MKVSIRSFRISIATLGYPSVSARSYFSEVFAGGTLAIAGMGEMPLEHLRLTDEESAALLALARTVGERINGEIRTEAAKAAVSRPVGFESLLSENRAEPVPQQ